MGKDDRIECRQCNRLTSRSKMGAHMQRCVASLFGDARVRKRPRVNCPLCGLEVGESWLRMHQESKRCNPSRLWQQPQEEQQKQRRQRRRQKERNQEQPLRQRQGERAGPTSPMASEARTVELRHKRAADDSQMDVMEVDDNSDGASVISMLDAWSVVTVLSSPISVASSSSPDS